VIEGVTETVGVFVGVPVGDAPGVTVALGVTVIVGVTDGVAV